jgi:creatinine amidohydrolase
VRARLLAVQTSWMRFGLPAGMYSKTETAYGIHGGDVETSLMLHFRPGLVAMDKAENFVSAVTRAEQEFELLRHTGPHAFAWIASDLNASGAVGEAGLATAEKGEATARHQVEGFLRLMTDIRTAELDDWLA